MLLMMIMIQSPKVSATVRDEHETNYVSPVSTRFQPDIQSLASSALLSNQSLVARGSDIWMDAFEPIIGPAQSHMISKFTVK